MCVRFCVCDIVFVCVCACISRTYIGGSQVCFSTARGSPRTLTRTGTEMFYPVSYFHSLPVSALLLGSSLPGVVPLPPPSPTITSLSFFFHTKSGATSWNLSIGAWGMLTVWSWLSHTAVLFWFQMTPPGWCFRARRTTSMPATSRCGVHHWCEILRPVTVWHLL